LNNKPLLSVKSDFVFKSIFGDQRNIEILSAFLKSIIDIPDDEFEQLTVVDPYLKKDYENDKYGILDVKIHTKRMNVIQVEIQLKVHKELKQRVIYGHSKLFTEQITSGQGWSVINRVISIIITDEVFIPDNLDYINPFRYRTKNGTEFSNLSEIITIDLRKLPTESDGTDLWNWVKFIKSNNEEELNMLAESKPQIKKAVAVLKELSADERTRMIAEAREFARRDAVSLMNRAIEEGKAEGFTIGKAEGIAEGIYSVAKNLLKINIPVEQIIAVTGLTKAELNSLKENSITMGNDNNANNL